MATTRHECITCAETGAATPRSGCTLAFRRAWRLASSYGVVVRRRRRGADIALRLAGAFRLSTMSTTSAKLTHAMSRRCRASATPESLSVFSCSQPSRLPAAPRLSALAFRVAVCGVRAKQVLPLAAQRAGRPRALCSGRCALLARCCKSAEEPPGESLCVSLLLAA